MQTRILATRTWSICSGPERPHSLLFSFAKHQKPRVSAAKAMTFAAEACLWRIEGDAAMLRPSHERNAVLDAIQEAGEPVGPNDIATAAGMRAGNVRRLLGKLVKEGAIEKVTRGRYRCANVTTSPA